MKRTPFRRNRFKKISKKKTVPKRTRLKRLHNRAWDLWSLIVRTREGFKCFTCGIMNHEGMQAGHFKHNVLDFDPMNIHCQCLRCNHFLSGNLSVYTLRLIELYGLEEVQSLEKRATMALSGEKKSEEDYEKMIEEFKETLSTL